MAALLNAAEPGLIALGFTAASLFNARDLLGFFRFWNWKYERVGGSPPHRETLPCLGRQVRVPDTTRFRHTAVSRLLWHAPFLMEIWYWNLAYWTYQLARAFSAVHLSPSAPETATAHGIAILTLEQRLGFAIELPIQRFFFSLPPAAMTILGKIYYSHIVLGVCYLGYMYTYRPDVFARIRRTMAVCNVIAFVIMTLYRVAPPRLLPKEYGFVDVLHGGQKHSAWTQNRFQLVWAAMPSLHFGTSFLVGGTLFLFAPHRAVRALAPLWPLAMFLTIAGTANHYVLDAAVGALIPLAAWRANRVLLHLRVLEEWAFWLCRAEKPPRAAGRGPYALNRRGAVGRGERWEEWTAGHESAARHDEREALFKEDDEESV